MSRFNTLYLGEAADAADELESPDADPEADLDEVRVALINALRRIDKLERQVAQLRVSEDA
jgi:hypothetical protein